MSYSLALLKNNYNFFLKHYKNIADIARGSGIMSINDEAGLQSYCDQVGCKVSEHQVQSEKIKQIDSLFDAIKKEKYIIQSIKAPVKGQYCYPRYFMRIADQLVSDITRFSSVNISNLTEYHLSFPVPLIVLYGVGNKSVVESMININNVNVVAVVEPNLNRFIISLSYIRWFDICSEFIDNFGKNVHFILGGDFRSQYGMLWNYLVKQCPIYPYQTIFADALSSVKERSVYNKIQHTLNLNMNKYLGSWGYYDDEINQINNSLYSLNKDIKFCGVKDGSSFCPVVLVGSGPSLDVRESQLHKIKNKSIVVSCGSALEVLYHKGIQPDYHIIKESDFVQYEMVNKIKDDGFLKKIVLITTVQSNPKSHNLFKSVYFVNTEASLMSYYLPEDIVKFKYCYPGCLNLAIDLFVGLGATKFILFGMDLGFSDIDHHHSKGAIYYDEDTSILIKNSVNYNRNELFEDLSVDGSVVYTNQNMNNLKLKFEAFLELHPNLFVYNFSDGVKIKNTFWMPFDRGDEVVSNMVDLSGSIREEYSQFIEQTSITFYKSSESNIVNNICSDFKSCIVEFQQFALECVVDRINAPSEFVTICYLLNDHVNSSLLNKSPSVYMLLRGACWHLLSIGLSHLYLLRESKLDFTEFYGIWRAAFLEFVYGVEQHFISRINKKYDDMMSDQWIQSSINDPE